MSINQDRLNKATAYIKEKLGHNQVDEVLLSKIISYIESGVETNDSAKVACSDKSELKYIRDHFLIGHINAPHTTEELDQATKAVCEEMGSSNRNKLREVFYYLLLNKLDLAEQYINNTSTDGHTDDSATTSQSTDSTETRLDQIINKYSRYAAIAGLAPFPIIDIAAIGTIQHKMIEKIALEFPQVRSKSSASRILTSIVGGFSSVELGLITKALFKSIPVVGTLIGGVSTSAYAYYSTQIIGDIFKEHFTSGGDLSIDNITFEKMREQYRKTIQSLNLSTS